MADEAAPERTLIEDQPPHPEPLYEPHPTATMRERMALARELEARRAAAAAEANPE